MAELVLKGGRVIDPSQNLDGVADVVFSDGRVKAVGRDAAHARDAEVRDAKGLIVTPGLIDLHTHVYWGGTSLGVDAAALARSSGTTTFVDAGSAGPGNFHGFRRHVIEPSPVRIIPYLNISFAGIFAFSASVMVGECADVRLLDLRECRKVAEANRDLVVGIKVRVGKGAGGSSGVAPLDMALEVAESVGLPVMAHLDFPPPSRREVMSRLRKGDVLTHCFRPFPNAPVKPSGGVREEIMEARARGVIFDIGHGQGSFGFGTTRAMLEAGFLPDVISSDVHILSIDGPAFDLLHTMSKFLVLGVTLPTVIRAATLAPAHAIGRSDLGTFKPGSVGDATLLAIEEGQFTYHDVLGEPLQGSKKLAAKGVVIGGKWWHP
ncbi:MAG TPA: amidohydrolase/deacetylase family metallohydrolase [Stellaceae bacterium]|nr:amidohydrolase/deacetylase family metallohydrolase [Stellaceae bacterium]